MKLLIFVFLIVQPLLFMTSCAIVNKKDCAEFDWSRRAQEDIQKNKDWQKYLAKYDRICTKHGYKISEDYLNGVQSKGGAICTGLPEFSEKGWRGVGVRDALRLSHPQPEKYTDACSVYKMTINLEAYNGGVKSVGGRACSSFESFDELGWTGVGVRDAESGQVSSLQTYLENCKKHYFTDVKTEDYNEGYKKGLKNFCTKKTGFEFAKKGGVYKETCKKNKSSFLKGYKIGLDVRKADALESEFKAAVFRTEEITNKISSLHKEIENLNESLRGQLSSYKSKKEDIADDMGAVSRRLESESEPDAQEDFSRRMTELREDMVDLENDTLSKETATQRTIEEARFTISRLREERRKIEKKIQTLESESRAARAKADMGLKLL